MTAQPLLTNGEHFAFETLSKERLDLYGALLGWTDSIKTGVVEKQYVKRSGSVFQKVGAPARRFEFKCRLTGSKVTERYRRIQGVLLAEPEGQLTHPRLGDMPAIVEELSSSESPTEDRDVIDFALHVAESGLRTPPTKWSVALAGGSLPSAAAVVALTSAASPGAAQAGLRVGGNVDAFLVAMQAAELGGAAGSLLDVDATLAAVSLSVQALDEYPDMPPGARRQAYLALGSILQARNAFIAGRPAIVRYQVQRAISLSNLCQSLYGGRGRAERETVERTNRILSARLIPAGTWLLITDPSARPAAD